MPEPEYYVMTWPRMSNEAYLDDPTVPQSSEWVDGYVVPTLIGSLPHSKLTGLFITALSLFVEDFDLGTIHHDPFNVKTGADLPDRAPEILFVNKQNLHRLRRKRLEGPADLVIEIVSDESRRRDQVIKLAEYEAGGVPEYWWLDQDVRDAGFYQMGGDPKYVCVGPDAAGVYQSVVLPRVRLNVAALWQNPLPKARDLLRTWGAA